MNPTREQASAFSVWLCHHRLTGAHLAVLLHCDDQKNQRRMTDIAHKLGYSTAAVTGLVQALVEQMLLERLHGEDDRRTITVQTTKRGKMMLKELFKES